ncbi:MAG: acetate--CoA ligase family protein [Chloroflexi bacterium]|nr:acetate--CoA ligase family protein [Chloroflexota bacterium]
MTKLDPSLTPFFNPRGVVIIGASTDPTKLGYGLARTLTQSGYQGAVHFVNPKGGTLLGHPVYAAVADVPDPVDLASVLIPSRFVPNALRDCGQRGIQAAIIGAGGFREIGLEGATLEEECLRIAQEYGIRLLGPNCVGLLDTHLPLDTTFLPPPGPTPGDVAFISHSGAICAAVIDWARGQGYGISRLVSLGNQADVSETDMLAPVADDPFTNVLALYLEGVKDGRRFVERAREVTRRKPIIALKVGRFEAGQRAVASHTGALAGQESAYNAAFRRAGVLRAMTSEGMFDRARALAWCPLPKGRRVAVITNAGGPGVTAADALESLGLKLADLSGETRADLQAILPPAASLHNPVDMLASASPGQFAESLRIVLADPNVDSAMVIYPTPPMFTSGAVAKAMIPVIHNSDKPVVIAVMGERLIQEAVEHLRAARIPEYRFPERAAAALSALVDRSELLKFARAEPVSMDDVKPDVVGDILDSQTSEVSETSEVFLSNDDACTILEAYGIPTLKMELAHTADQATACARRTGFPVALKIASSDIPHKSDVGGVLLGLGDAEAVRAGFAAVTRLARAAHPEAEIDGVHVQRMVASGQEVIVGAVQDPQFGALVMFGSGGTEVEGLKDVAFALAPLTRIEAEYMLENTWAGKKLKGFRNLPPADREAVLDVLIRLAQLSADFPALTEIEINPLRVLPEGQGAVAVDVRIRVN